MRSPSSPDDLARRRRRQSGQSLIEALIASMVVGIAVVAGIGTLDAAVTGAREVAIQAWGECMQRGELQAVMAAPWSDTGYAAPAQVSVQVVPVAAGAERITVSVANPRTGGAIARLNPVSVYKAQAVSPAGAAPYDPAAISAGCRSFGSGG